MTQKTPLHAWHQSKGARMIDFGGWDMPVTYSSINAEHEATRTKATLFDICHMGRVKFTGPDTVAYLDHVLTNRVDSLALGQARYALVLNEDGGIRDDILAYRFDDFHMLVVNASNREKLLEWFEQQKSSFEVTIEDKTSAWGMVAVQGPQALEAAQQHFAVDLKSIPYYHASKGEYDGEFAILSRTGYTGEDGVELIVAADKVEELAEKLVNSGVLPAGLGARDTLRMEAGMPLYGHELSESIDPVQAGLGWAVKAKQKDFVGKAALLKRPEDRPVRVGLKLTGKRIPREGFTVLHGNKEVGTVTSGTFSPTLQSSIAMAMVNPEVSSVGTSVAVAIRNAIEPAEVVSLPFYKREKK